MPSSSTADDFTHTAQSLASAPDSPGSPKRPSWPRSNSSTMRAPLWSRSESGSRPEGEEPWYTALVRLAVTTVFGAWRLFKRLTPLQKIAVVVVLLITNTLVIMALIYGERIYEWLAPQADRWRESSFGWVVLWFFTFLSAFPPMFGYSTCVTLAGFIYGMPGWFIVASANVIGSTASFVVCRRYLSEFSQRLAAKEPRIQAFSLVVQRDGFPLLCAIRLCPLPYALSNGGLSTVQSIRASRFAAATAVAAPKLLLHVFVGSRLAVIAHGSAGEHTMDTGAKIANYVGIAAGVFVGAATGWIIYRRTAARARALEAEERVLLEEGRAGEDHTSSAFGGLNRRTSNLSRKSFNGASSDGIALGGGLEHPDAFSDDPFVDDDAVAQEEAWMAGAEDRDEIDFLQSGYGDTNERNGDVRAGRGSRASGDDESKASLLRGKTAGR